MSALQEYFYNNQLRQYMIQFMAIFADMKVQVGANSTEGPRLISVPITNASKDRIVAWIKGEQTQNKPIRLPMFAATLTNIELAPELRKGVGQTRRKTMMPVGGLFPDDMQVIEQRQPVPYRATFELGIWASNQDQHYQIIEQILMIFDPLLQIQTSDEVFDWGRITQVELTGIAFGENVPAGSDRRLIQTTLTFSVPIYLQCPANVHKNYVERIFMRIGAVSQVANTSEDVIAELDAQGIDYVEIFNADDVNLGS